jgi:hypothetical protein
MDIEGSYNPGEHPEFPPTDRNYWYFVGRAVPATPPASRIDTAFPLPVASLNVFATNG